MQEEEEKTVRGYETIYHNDKTSNCGEITIAVKNTMKKITMQVKQERELGQTLWILLNNQKKKIKIGVIYAPQEGVTPNKELKKLHTSITEEIIKAKEEDQQSIITGYFNSKIGDSINGNMSAVTKRGRLFKKMIDKYDMKLVNEEQEICKGLWTREQEKDKSVIDYVITDKKYFSTIKGMYIDQNKEYATFKIERKESEDIKKIYSDNNVIILKVDFMTEMQKEKRKRIITTKGYKEYQQILQHKTISKIMQTGNLQNRYDIWSQAIEDTVKKVEKVTKKGPKERCERINQNAERTKERISSRNKFLQQKANNRKNKND